VVNRSRTVMFVLVHDDCVRVNWKLAIIEGLDEEKDGTVHSATISTKNGVINRPVQNFIPLK